MPEEPPSKSVLLKPGKGGGISEGSEQSHSDGSSESSSSEESESESERASQLSYLQKQVSSSHSRLLEFTSLPPLSVQVMIVHQQLAALAGGKASKKLLGVDLPGNMDDGDPSFNPNHPNTSNVVKKKKTKKVKKEPQKPKKPVAAPVAPPAKRLTSK